ncbi:hypothetical protein [Yinghuangia soli]|uniref:Uncharacterized protein n=1 Tax=Yinghuangia soli TaxID=2908204 RepID=A0AA41U4T4_9ACTN|nr:hypothetical protein [Yinghuangia soli]MCF2533296.1 hypothetical protein [Yinghuangia soli]
MAHDPGTGSEPPTRTADSGDSAARLRTETADEARKFLVDSIVHLAGTPDRGPAWAEALLRDAGLWSTRAARALAAHLADYPDAFTAPRPDCPLALVRLARHLEHRGLGALVTQPACARCGRDDVALPRTTEDGRCCQWCLSQPYARPCARCGRRLPLAAGRHTGGPVCRGCHADAPRRCRVCGRAEAPRERTECDACRAPHNVREGPARPAAPPAGTCQGCDTMQDVYADGLCVRCLTRRCIRELLTSTGRDPRDPADPDPRDPADPDPRDPAAADPRDPAAPGVHPDLVPLAAALENAVQPHSVLTWLRRGASAALLASLAADPAPLTHERLDAFPNDHSTRCVREMLVATGTLPRRDEYLARSAQWLRAASRCWPRHHRDTLLAFADDALDRGAGRHTAERATRDRAAIRAAADLLAWLDAAGLDLADLDPAFMAAWSAGTTPGRRRAVPAFLRWTADTGRSKTVRVPQQAAADPVPRPARLAAATGRTAEDPGLPVDVRIIAGLAQACGLTAAQICRLTHDDFRHGPHGMSLAADGDEATVLPAPLAALIRGRIERAPRTSILAMPGVAPDYLLPGRPPSRPRNVASLQQLLRRHGISLHRTAAATPRGQAAAPPPPHHRTANDGGTP